MINAHCLAEPLPGYRHSHLNLAVAVSRRDTLQGSLPNTTDGDISEAKADDSELRTDTTPASVPLAPNPLSAERATQCHADDGDLSEAEAADSDLRTDTTPASVPRARPEQ